MDDLYMLTPDDAQKLIDEDQAAVTPVAPRGKKFQMAFFGSNTGSAAKTLFSFLDEPSRGALEGTHVDAYRLSRVDRTFTNATFKMALMHEILSALRNPAYQDVLSVSRNPSGFLRLNNDLISLVTNQALLATIPDAAELRLNFWPGTLYQDLGAKLEQETAHSHPRGFTSFIVHGGYKHNIYFASTEPKKPGDVQYRFVAEGVDNGTKQFTLTEGEHVIAPAMQERVQGSSDYAYFSTQMIHEVATRISADDAAADHGTLSINVVFGKYRSEAAPKYNIYLNSEAGLVPQYPKLDAALAQRTLAIVCGLLEDRIAGVEASLAVVKVSSNPLSMFGGGFSAAVNAVNTAARDVHLPAVTVLPDADTNTADDGVAETVALTVSA